MIIDILQFNIKEECIDDAIDLMKKQLPNVRNDEGCFLAHVFRSKKSPCELFLMLGWENQESIDMHLNTDHDRRFREELDPMLSGPPDMANWEVLG